jgi:hydroxyacylglutathione hydrolase
MKAFMQFSLNIYFNGNQYLYLQKKNMYIEQIYTSCLSEASYYIESENEVAIIDPIRDIEIYLEKAKSRNATIKYVIETHFHADFVSGHLDLSKATGAPIIYGPNATTNFAIHSLTDGEKLSLGNISLTALHTPGHTLESTCYLLKDSNDKDYAIFTGDTLFVGDVGRPDLFSGNLTKEALAKMMYQSLNTKIMPLADHVIVYPAHGPGSSCGKNLGKETSSTIGQQKMTNYALQASTETEFVTNLITGLNIPPTYFPINAQINKTGYMPLSDITQQAKALSIDNFNIQKNNGALILDTRPATVFTQGFVPGSLFIGLEGRFAEWAGSLLPFNRTIILVTETGKENETITRLARVGFEKIAGYLEGGFEKWQAANEPVDLIIDVDADELRMDMQFDNNMTIVDVRKSTEYENGHIDVAENFSLLELYNSYTELPTSSPLYLHCAGGYRSVIAASILKSKGIHLLRNVLGGWSSISQVQDMPIVYPAKTVSLN